jgi:predicted NAD-dependent protein-ADP-ribosyltransferase YbiA (DUF1768 family)
MMLFDFEPPLITCGVCESDDVASAMGSQHEPREKRDRATKLTLSDLAFRERFRSLTPEEAAARSRLVAREMAARWRAVNSEKSQEAADQRYRQRIGRLHAEQR